MSIVVVVVVVVVDVGVRAVAVVARFYRRWSARCRLTVLVGVDEWCRVVHACTYLLVDVCSHVDERRRHCKRVHTNCHHERAMAATTVDCNHEHANVDIN